MEIYYHKTTSGNFGDELNRVFWPLAMGEDFFQNHNEGLLVGMGTLLCNSHFSEKQQNRPKVLAGAGIRPSGKPFNLDESWKIYFVRGHESASALSLPPDYGLGDPAFLAPITFNIKAVGKSEVIGLMPWFRSVNALNWVSVAEKGKFKLIDPRGFDPVKTIREISGCKVLITESLHGAIVADAMGIPWKRMKFFSHLYEGEMVSGFKWRDWCSSLKVECPAGLKLPYDPVAHRLHKWARLEKQSLKNEIVELLVHEKKEGFVHSKPEEKKQLIERLADSLRQIAHDCAQKPAH